MNKSMGLVFRMENVEGAEVPEEVTADSALAAEAGAVEATDAVESASGDVTEVVTGIENASEAAGELSSIEGSLEEAVEDGEGISGREAEHIQARLERVASLLGTSTDNMGLTFRKESFGGNQSKLAATKLKLEFVKEWGGKIWGVILKAWEWVKAAVAKLITNITGSAAKLEERLKSLQKQVNEAQAAGKTIGTEKIKSKAGVFSIEGVTSAATVKKFLENGANYAQIMTDVAKTVTPNEVEKMAAGKDVKAYSDTLAAIFSKGTLANSLPKGTEGAKGLILLPNNQAVIASPKKLKNGETEITATELITGKASDKAAEEYAPLSFDEMKSVLTSALAGASGLKAFQKIQKDLDSVSNANISYAQQMMKAGSSIMEKGAEDGEAKKGVRDMAATVKAMHDLSVKAVSLSSNVLPRACFDVISGAGDIVAASLSSGKATEKKD